jgi:hypothetical protein
MFKILTRLVGADHISRQRPHIVQQDGRLLVEVGVEEDAPLLHENAAVMFPGSERIA